METAEVEHDIYVFPPDMPGADTIVDYYTERYGGKPFMVHDHLRVTACDGTCPIYNAPNEDAS